MAPGIGEPSRSQRRLKERSLPSDAPVLIHSPSLPVSSSPKTPDPVIIGGPVDSAATGR